MPVSTAYLWLVVVPGGLVAVVLAVLVEERRPTVVGDPALDVESITRVVADLGLVSSWSRPSH